VAEQLQVDYLQHQQITTQTANQYFQDSQGNIYDATGTLIYTNPSQPYFRGTMDGGGYDPNATDTTSGGTSQVDHHNTYKMHKVMFMMKMVH
jgi:hypothetical protein